MENIALILIAAEAPIGDGWIRHVAEAALASPCTPVVVALGMDVEAHRDALDGLDVVVVENPDWQEGIGTSIQAGVNGALILGCDGAILALAAAPAISAQALSRLIARYEETGLPIVASSDSSFAPVPALFSREIFSKLLALAPGQDWTSVIRAHPDQTSVVPTAGV
jgi:CTP:molybdopterin cytidylyltransferase MocA